jgi:N-methylhydantoinase A
MMRYSGQSFELPVPGPLAPDPAALAEAFAAEHESRYGYRDDESPVELVDILVAVRAPGPEIVTVAATGTPAMASRPIWDGSDWTEATVIAGEPAAGAELEGPCVIELPEATLVLPARWQGRVDEHGSIVAKRAVSR